MVKFDQKKFDEVLKLIEEGESLRKSCELVKFNRSTFYYVIDERDDLKDKYARATKDRHDKIFEEILDIADDSSNDYITDSEGFEKLNQEHVQRSKLKIDARKWMLGKMNPKKYGEHLKIDQTVNERKNVADLFPDELKDKEND